MMMMMMMMMNEGDVTKKLIFQNFIYKFYIQKEKEKRGR
jgi:hypothetical protein